MFTVWAKSSAEPDANPKRPTYKYVTKRFRGQLQLFGVEKMELELTLIRNSRAKIM